MACNATSELKIFEGLRLARFIFTLRALEEMTLPPYKGSLLRGGFGHALLQVACQLGRWSCNLQCPTVHRCAYVYIFQTQRPPQDRVFEGTEDVPHPFVLLPPLDEKRHYRVGEGLAFSLVLVGRAIDLFPYVVEAIRRMGEAGLGVDRRRCRLEGVESVDGQGRSKVLYRAGQDLLDMDFALVTERDLRYPGISSGQLGLEFLTPTRIKQGDRWVPPKDFFTIFKALVSRLSLLYHFHCTDNAETFRHLDVIKERAKGIRTISQKLLWYPRERYSGRQNQKNSIGGFIGRAVFDGNLEEFLPFLLLGEHLHIGKGTVYGCGKYVLSDPPESIRQTNPAVSR